MSKRDRTYPVPRHTRFVWVSSEHGPQYPPSQGLVLEWRRYRYRWYALVQTVVEEPGRRAMTVMAWLPAERLIPVVADPNDGRPRRLV